MRKMRDPRQHEPGTNLHRLRVTANVMVHADWDLHLHSNGHSENFRKCSLHIDMQRLPKQGPLIAQVHLEGVQRFTAALGHRRASLNTSTRVNSRYRSLPRSLFTSRLILFQLQNTSHTYPICGAHAAGLDRNTAACNRVGERAQSARQSPKTDPSNRVSRAPSLHRHSNFAEPCTIR